jgi:methyl-accepting chemotaxis protein
MQLNISKKMALGFGVIIALLIAFGVLVLINVSSIIEQFTFVATHDTPSIKNARQLKTLVVDMQNGERGFSITQKGEFLETYTTGITEFKSLMAEEKNLVSNDPAQVRRLEKIEGLVNEWQEKAAKPQIAMARRVAEATVDANQLQEIISREVGKGLTDNIRSILDGMIANFRRAGNRDAIILAVSIERDIVDLQTGKRGFLITGKDSFLESYNTGQKNLKDDIASLRRLLAGDQTNSRLLAEVESLANDWIENTSKPEINARYEMNKHPETIQDIAAMIQKGTGKNIIDQIRVEFDRFIQVEDDSRTKRYDHASSDSRSTILMTIILVIVSVAFGSVIAIFITRGITRSIRTLVNATDIVSKGDLTPEIEALNKDEIGKLAGSFKQMVNNLKNMVLRARSSSEEVSSSSQQLSSAAQQTNASVQQVSSAIQQLAKGSQTQAQRVEETSRAMEQLSVSVSQTAQSAQQAASASSQASQSAKQGSETVNETVSTMDKIFESTNSTSEAVTKLSERSEQMAEIIEVISNVADQTNLLALNAAIEAARAGEAGKGFAVVAEEVRKLAESSAQSASRIGQLIKETIKDTQEAAQSMQNVFGQVSQGKDVVAKTSQAIEEILQANQNVATMLDQISAAAEQMSANANQVAKSVEEVATIAEEASASTQQASSSTEQMVATMEEMASSAQSLAQMGIDLNSLVAEFKTGEETASKKPQRMMPSTRRMFAVPIADRLAEAREKMKIRVDKEKEEDV